MDTKSIKVYADTWRRLDLYRLKGHTFDDVIEALLDNQDRVEVLKAEIKRGEQ